MRKIFAPVLVWQQDMIIRNREKGISDFVKRYGRDIAEHMADSFLKFIYKINFKYDRSNELDPFA